MPQKQEGKAMTIKKTELLDNKTIRALTATNMLVYLNAIPWEEMKKQIKIKYVGRRIIIMIKKRTKYIGFDGK